MKLTYANMETIDMKNYLPNDLFSFAAIVSHAGFTKAAQELGVSASVLSKRIKRLETTLGVNLLQRTTRELHLTEAGRECYDEITELKNGFENIIEKIKSTQLHPKGTVKISAPYSFGQLYLAPALWEFMKLYPELDIELMLGQSSIRLMEKNIDVGIFIKEVPDSRLIAKKIGVRKMMLCGAPSYFKKKGIPKIPQDLINHNCLLYQGEYLKDEWQFKKTIVKVRGNFSANSSQILMQTAIAGKGIVKLPGYLAQEALKEKKLISILDEYCPKDIGIFTAYPYTRHPSQNVKALINFLVKRFSSIEHEFRRF